ncbi:hypothetical protein llap_13369 [Limosa lapponica baueri]|uniref:Uncharacterized protein n=1 Tax=Limosa lapponica baueri TaxID=1758121 RepID=A0A2I0TRB6_LIMLA|nr:hypothetical protein llap_13369 [Limosa lapponica baueri]
MWTGESKDTPCDIKAGDDKDSLFQGQQDFKPGYQATNRRIENFFARPSSIRLCINHWKPKPTSKRENPELALYPANARVFFTNTRNPRGSPHANKGELWMNQTVKLFRETRNTLAESYEQLISSPMANANNEQ